MTEKYVIHEEEYKGYVIRLEYDDDSLDPREWDNLGTMLCKHSRYNLGDVQIGGRGADPYFEDVQEAREFIYSKDVIALPIYIYEHSGITINTSGFSCPWDSGQVGWIYVTKEQLRKEYNRKRITQKIIKRALEVLEGEVETYDTYLRGEVVGWMVCDKDDFDFPLDSCWGYFSEDDALTDARGTVDWMVKQALKEGVQPPLPTLEVHFPDVPDWVVNPGGA